MEKLKTIQEMCKCENLKVLILNKNNNPKARNCIDCGNVFVEINGKFVKSEDWEKYTDEEDY